MSPTLNLFPISYRLIYIFILVLQSTLILEWEKVDEYENDNENRFNETYEEQCNLFEYLTHGLVIKESHLCNQRGILKGFSLKF